MTARSRTDSRWRQPLAVAPFLVVAVAGIAVRLPIAVAYPSVALLLFLWVVSDTMMLALVARSVRRPPIAVVLGTMAGACAIVALGAPAALRNVLWTKPAIAIGMAIVVLAHVGLGGARAWRRLTEPDSGVERRWTEAVSEILPARLVRLAAAELSVIHMALFRWGGPADVPADARAFSYHRHLAPIGTALLILSTIEIAVCHLLVGHWSRTAAIVMFVLSDLGFVYLLGLIKSFRFRPILLTARGVHVRAGFLIDRFVPLDAIAEIETRFSGERVREPATLNAALLAWPNVIIRLTEPVPRRSLLAALGRRKGPVSTIAFRVDEPEPFVRLLRWRLGHTPA